MAYNKDTDYKALIDQAAANGDYRRAALLEQQRNEKIAGEGLKNAPTSDYAGWLDKTDYGEKIKSAISGKAPKGLVADLLADRVEKAANTVGMEKWAKDDIYDMAMKYFSSSPSSERYGSPYSSQIEELLKKLLERERFSYDHETDPLYQAYAKVYQREGKRAAEDALGLTTQNTGGYASSYSAGAVQQAGSYYSAKQADKIPELYKLAYEIYKDDFEQDVESMGVLQKLEDSDYKRWRDSLEDIYRQEELDYKKYLDQLGLSQKQEQLEYDRSRDALADQRYDQQWRYKLAKDGVKGEGKGGDGPSEEETAPQPAGTQNKKRPASVGKEGLVKIYGLDGSFTLDEAEDMVELGLAQRFTVGSDTYYKLVSVN